MDSRDAGGFPALARCTECEIAPIAARCARLCSTMTCSPVRSVLYMTYGVRRWRSCSLANVGIGAAKKDQRAKELGYSDAFSWTRTDANGQFVLKKLPAGTYLVSVNGPAGYGANPDKGGWYHETWYPQAQSWKEAEPITLKEGDERNGLEISVERERRYRIIIWPSGPEGGPKPDDYEIHLEHRNFGCERDADGSYVIPGIPPGHYALTIL